MPTQAITLKFPGPMARDPRYSVTFRESEFPSSPITIHFVRIGVEGGGSLHTDYFNVGVEIGERFAVEPGSERQPIDHLPRRRLDPAVVRHVAVNYVAYESRARAQLQGGIEPDPSAVIVAPQEARKRREMTPAFLETVASQYVGYRDEGKAPLKELVRDYGVNQSTVSRWVKAARQSGLINEQGGSYAS
jgi:hypothetical protein